jgi:hypothetical protein
MALTTFTTGQVLTAAQLNAVQANDYNQTVSTKTVSYTLVAADKGTRVVMNAAGSTTITVNTSLFSAGDTVVLQNIGAGVTTVTAGTATVSSAGPLAIPQYGSGTLYFTSAGVAIYFPSAVTVAAPAASALTFITSGQVTAATSTDVTGVFSATYNNYLLIIENLTTSADGYALRLQYGTGSADTANTYINSQNFSAAGASTFIFIAAADTTATESTGLIANIFSPNLATATGLTCMTSARNNDQAGISTNSAKQTTTQYTSLHFTTESPENSTFKYSLYGYAIS